MSDLDARLTAALEADAPPSRDPLFRVEVLERLERTRFQRRVVLILAIAAAAGLAAALNAQAVSDWMAADLRRVVLVAIGAAVAMFPLAGVPLKATPGARTVAKLLERWL